ncbi:type II toxin-antitoxin system VapC family toxin [Pigmentiphaga litoralis]|uniref:type II toxin-antitoxin system VapC family toxin n=1 Tax=Pigmentiphaga litoralis TaxID=516702 RepID=UPI003B42B8B4
MSVLVDTSVWVDHFRKHNSTLELLMLQDDVLTHPMVIAEIACGTPPAPRQKTLADLDTLRQVRQASVAEVRDLIERDSLFGMGCGFIDITLVASTLITPNARVWTKDRRLLDLADRYGVAYRPRAH